MTIPFAGICTAGNRLAWFPGDGSERCLICGVRRPDQSLYVGQIGVRTHDDLPERFPVCSEPHGIDWMRRVWNRALQDANETIINRPAPVSDDYWRRRNES